MHALQGFRPGKALTAGRADQDRAELLSTAVQVLTSMIRDGCSPSESNAKLAVRVAASLIAATDDLLCDDASVDLNADETPSSLLDTKGDDAEQVPTACADSRPGTDTAVLAAVEESDSADASGEGLTLGDSESEIDL